MLETLRRWVPITCQAFVEYGLEGARLSKTALGVVRRILAGETLEQKDSGLGPREWREVMALLGRGG